MYISAGDVVGRIESYLRGTTLSAAQTAGVAVCTTQAYWKVIGALTSRHGLSRAEADAWPLGAQFQSDIAFFWSLKSLELYQPVETGKKNPIDAFNRESELLGKDLPLITAAGEAIGSREDPGFTVVDLDEAEIE